MSYIRQNYTTDCEAAINKQINLELHASYIYMSMVCVIGRALSKLLQGLGLLIV